MMVGPSILMVRSEMVMLDWGCLSVGFIFVVGNGLRFGRLLPSVIGRLRGQGRDRGLRRQIAITIRPLLARALELQLKVLEARLYHLAFLVILTRLLEGFFKSCLTRILRSVAIPRILPLRIILALEGGLLSSPSHCDSLEVDHHWVFVSHEDVRT